MTRAGVIFCLLFSVVCARGVLPAETAPKDVIAYVQGLGEDPAGLQSELTELLPLLEDRRTTPGPTGIPQSPSSELRKLLRTHLPTVEESLVILYPDQTEPVQLVLVDVFGWGTSGASFELLWEQLAQAPSVIRRQAMDALLRREDESRAAAAARFIEPESLSNVQQARLIGALNVPECYPALLHMLEHGGETESLTAEWALEQAGLFILPTLIEAYYSTEREALKEGLLRVFCDLEHEDSISLLASALGADQPESRRIIILNHCAFMQVNELKILALDALFSNDLPVKQSAITALGRSQDPTMAIPLACIDSKGPNSIKDYTVPAIRSLGEDAAHLLVSSLHTKNSAVRYASVYGVMALDEVAAPMMLNMISHPAISIQTRQDLAYLLTRIDNLKGPPDQIAFFRLAASYPVVEGGFRDQWLPTYQAVASHPDPFLRIGALTHLGGFHDDKSTEILVRALKDPELRVALVAGRTLNSRLFTIRDRAREMMKNEPYWASRNIALGLMEAGYDPHRPADLAELYTSLGRWHSIDLLADESRNYMVRQWWNSENNDAVIRYAYALNQMAAEPFQAMLWESEIRNDVLAWMPWQAMSVRLDAFKNLDQIPTMDRARLMALAAVSNNDELLSALSDYLVSAEHLHLDFLLSMLNTRNPRLAFLARDILYARESVNNDEVEAAMLKAPPYIGQILAEVLFDFGYSPQTTENALVYHKYLRGWYQLAAMGQPGIAALRDGLDEVVGREKLDLVVLLSTMLREHPLRNMLDVTVQNMKSLYPHLLQYFEGQDTQMINGLRKILTSANIDQTLLVLRLLNDLKVEPEEPIEKILIALAVRKGAIFEDQEELKNFYAKELTGGSPANIMRASLLRINQPEEKGLRIKMSLVSTQDFEQKIVSTNINEIYMAVLAAPVLVENVDNKDEVVDALIELMKTHKGGRTVSGSYRNNDRVVSIAEDVSDVLAKIGEPAIEPLREVWTYGGMTQRMLAAKALCKIPSTSLVSIQRKIMMTSSFPTALRLDAIRSLAALKDLANLDYFFSILLIEREKIQNESMMDAGVDAGGSRRVRNETLQAVLSYESLATDYLLEKLALDSKAVRLQAVQLLADIDDPRAVSALETLNEQDSIQLQIEIVRALDRHHQSSSLPVLAGYLDSPSHRVYLMASDVLSTWGPEAFPAVLSVLPKGSNDQRELKAATLRRLTGQRFGTSAGEWRTWARKTGYGDL